MEKGVKEILELERKIEFPKEEDSIEKVTEKVIRLKEQLKKLPKEIKEILKEEIVEAKQGIENFLSQIALKKREPEIFVEDADELILKSLLGKIAPLKERLEVEIGKFIQRTIEEKALREKDIEEEIRKRKKEELEPLKEELRELVKRFASGVTAEGYLQYVTPRVEVTLQRISTHKTDPWEFLAILQKKIKKPEERRFAIRNCLRVIYESAKRSKVISKEELDKITEVEERKPKVIVKPRKGFEKEVKK